MTSPWDEMLSRFPPKPARHELQRWRLWEDVVQIFHRRVARRLDSTGRREIGRGNSSEGVCYVLVLIFFTHICFPASGQAVVTGVVPSPPPVLALNFYRAYVGFSNPIARRFFI